MNILLINPWICDFAAFDLWIKPLGLLYIGSFLEQFGYTVELIDCLDRFHPTVIGKTKTKKYATGKFFAEEIPKPSFVHDIPRKFKRYGICPNILESELKNKGEPQLIIITSIMTYWYPGLFETIRKIKSVFPHTPIILGGIYATLCTTHAEKYAGAQHIIRGDGKIETLKIADTLLHKKRSYDTISVDLDKVPYPAYHLYERIDSVSMLSSIGCPYHCTYCAANIIQPHFIERNPHAVFKEILYYRDLFSIQDIAFYDDALLLNAESRFMPLAEKIIAQNLNIRFHTPNGLNIRFINERISHLLHNAGFKTIRLSFESASGRIQQDSSMKATNEELKRAQKYLRKAGYHKAEIEVYVMVGLPHQSHAEVIHTINFVHDLGLTVKLVQYSPIPHTVDYERTAAQYDFIKEDPLYHNNTVFASKTTEIGAAHLHEIKNLVQELNNKVCTGAKTKGGQS